MEVDMKRTLAGTALCLAIAVPTHAANPRVEMETNYGSVTFELYADKAPLTVSNFLRYVENGFYEGTVFHRVVNRFIVQGGAYDTGLAAKQPLEPIASEAKNGLLNEPGTLAMARGREIDSATSQFYVNLDSNKFLNHYKDHPDYYGYCVFGRVVKGMDVLKKIAEVPTGAAGPLKEDVPLSPVVVQKVAVLPPESEPASKPKGKSNGKTKNKPRDHLAGT
jgi:cyclophilin family peptidyl-prolyl cis-trans isomerase